jgi:hypothetical protein
MTLTEWLLFFAIIDGPIIGALYLIWKRFKKEVIVGPPHMEEAMWYILIGIFVMIWMWMFIWM